MVWGEEAAMVCSEEAAVVSGGKLVHAGATWFLVVNWSTLVLQSHEMCSHLVDLLQRTVILLTLCQIQMPRFFWLSWYMH